jgi:diaminopimelate decarboxylase
VTSFELFHPAHATGQSVGGAPNAYAGLANPLKMDRHDALGRLQTYRKVFRGAAISCPAQMLAQPDAAMAVRKKGHAVDVRSYDELTLALSVDIPASRIVMHDDGITAAPIRCAVNAGVGRLVVACCHQVTVLASCAQRPQRVLVDVTTDCATATATATTAVSARRRLNLIGLHAGLTPTADPTDYADVVEQMIGQMADIRREHDVILTRVSLAGGAALSSTPARVGELRALAAALDDALDEACARFRFPRPALILAPW